MCALSCVRQASNAGFPLNIRDFRATLSPPLRRNPLRVDLNCCLESWRRVFLLDLAAEEPVGLARRGREHQSTLFDVRQAQHVPDLVSEHVNLLGKRSRSDFDERITPVRTAPVKRNAANA